jgi:hypothetical protein
MLYKGGKTQRKHVKIKIKPIRIMDLVGLYLAIIAEAGFAKTLVAQPAASERSGMIQGRLKPG